MKKTIGILAHVDSGKTTFCEQLLYYTKSIRTLGRVDHKDSFLDNNEIERERGITVFSEQGVFKYNKSEYYLVDTPGHLDFSCEMERALNVIDYGIIIINAAEGVEGHTKTIWNLLKSRNIPIFTFLNKMDRIGADKDLVLDDIKKNLSKDIFFIDRNYFQNNNDDYTLIVNDNMKENICDYDEELMEKYLDGNNIDNEVIDVLKRLVKSRKIYPVMMGSALNNEGIKEFLCALDLLTYTEYENKLEEEFSGIVYKIRHDDKKSRITFIKCIEGQIKAKDEISYINDKGEIICDKINGLKIYNGDKQSVVSTAYAGDIVAVTGLKDVMPGDYVGRYKRKSDFLIEPALLSKVIFDDKLNVQDVLSVFRILESEDPKLNVEWNESLKEIQISIMGRIQLEVLKCEILNRFNLDVDFGPCRILYKETIKNKTYGFGHFEPLRHYAEVHFMIEPIERNSGIQFESKCHVDNLSVNYQNLIKTHIFEKVHKGVLTGSPVTDIKITLLNGKSHLKHTCGGDFREAVYRAIRQGLCKAESELLEPYYKFTMNIPTEYVGRAMTDITKLSGEFEQPESNSDKTVITGRGPVATFMDYYLEVITYTKGKGNINFIYDGYDICHNKQEIIEKYNYDKEKDAENICGSVFCAHGSGYNVPWYEADEKMHCDINY